mgnify:CR=1 FL=1
MGVGLGESADAQQAVQRAGRLVAVDLAELAEPQRQVAVALYPLGERRADDGLAGGPHRDGRRVPTGGDPQPQKLPVMPDQAKTARYKAPVSK